jgi:hypothetical protein
MFITRNKKLFRDTKALPSVSGDSDHRMVLSILNISKPKEKVKRRRERLKVENIKNEETVRELREKVAQRIHSDEDGSLEEQWKTFKEGLVSAGKETLGVKVLRGTKKKQTAWWTEEVRTAVKHKMRMYRKWMKTRNMVDREIYVNARRETEIIKKKNKKEMWEKVGRDLEQDLVGTRKLMYSMARNYRKGQSERTRSIKDKNGNLLLEDEDVADRWKEYFSELLNVEDENGNEIDDEREFDEINVDQHEDAITEVEVKKALENMKDGKAAGEDELLSEVIKAGGPDTLSILSVILDKAYREEIIPSDWQKGIICPIYKNKGARADCNNHRGITLLSHTGKIYERIIERRIRATVENKLGSWQHGFRPGRGTVDLVFALKLLLEKSWEWNKKKYVAFIDLEKAFDRINRRKLWALLADEHYGIDRKLVRVSRGMYGECLNKVRSDGSDSGWFQVRTGVKQGGVLSPLLFVIYMDSVLRSVCTNEDNEITLAYADDIALVTDSEEALQAALNRWNERLEMSGLRMNKTKTEVMVVGRNREVLGISVDGNALKQASDFCYLGVSFNEENTQDKEINSRISKYNSNVHMLYPLLKDKNVPSKCKVLIYTTILKPILIYGAECWSLTTKTGSKLQAAEMKVLRLIKGVTKRDRLTNVFIRDQLHITSLLEEIERSKLRWFGHVKRMEESRSARRFMEWEPGGRRPVGRPRKRWADGIKDSLRKRGMSLEEVDRTRSYDDRSNWRAVIWNRLTDR